MKWITPMEPISSKVIYTGDEWIYQIKWDGIRGLLYYQEETGTVPVQVFTKNGRNRTAFYPELYKIRDLIKGDSAVLDGEMVVLRDDGKPEFQMSLIRERVGNTSRLKYYTQHYPVIYIVFDILYHNGRLLTDLPLMERRSILNHSLMADSNISIARDFDDGPELFRLMKNKGWEGIVSKKTHSPYLPAKNHSVWFKHKALKKILAAVCGIQWKDDFPNSLILGILQEGNWVYIGRASIGLNQNDWYQLKEYALKEKKEDSPFKDAGQWKSKPVIWLKPALTCWVRFLEWTKDGVLRHPGILGFANYPAEEADGKEWSADE